MADYFCQSCAAVAGIFFPQSFGPLTGTRYQHGKYIKHTNVASDQGFNSVFTGPASRSYAAAIGAAVSSGFIERDRHSRINIVWPASRNIGFITVNGALAGSADAVKVVLPNDPQRIHGFPVCATFTATACHSCGTTF